MSASVESTGWDDPFLELCADPAFAASLTAFEQEWTGEEPFVDAVRDAPDDRLVEVEVWCSAPSCREVLADAAGADWARRMVLLEQLDPVALDGWEAEEYARLWAGVAARVAYRQLGARLAVAARCRSPKKGGADFAGVSLAVAEKVSPGTAELRLADARRAVERLPDLVALLGAGQITDAHVRKALEVTNTLELDACLQVQAQVADRAPDVAPAQLGTIVRREAAAIDSEAFTKRQAQARADRVVYVRPGEDGMAFLGISGPATQVALAHLSLDETARALRAAGDPRALDQLRCDLALERLQGIADERCADGQSADGQSTSRASGPAVERTQPEGVRPERMKHGRKVRVVVHVDAEALLHAADTPGEITGIGPVPAEIARELAGASNDWWRMLVDPSTGTCRDYGRLKKPGQDLVDLIVAGDQTCRAPMYDRAVDDLDHARERQHGGLTVEANLEGLSGHCHTIKSDGGWQPSINSDRSVTWTSPHGTEHTVRAPDHRLRPRKPSRLDPSTVPEGTYMREVLDRLWRAMNKPPLPDDAPPPF